MNDTSSFSVDSNKHPYFKLREDHYIEKFWKEKRKARPDYFYCVINIKIKQEEVKQSARSELAA